MAAPLESEIMADIGLGSYPLYYIGSSSCGWIAREAARRLPDALRKRHEAGEEVASPHDRLIRLLRAVAESSDMYATALTPTWETASYVIQAHLYAYHDKDTKKREATWRTFEKEIRERYLPREDMLIDYETGMVVRRRGWR